MPRPSAVTTSWPSSARAGTRQALIAVHSVRAVAVGVRPGDQHRAGAALALGAALLGAGQALVAQPVERGDVRLDPGDGALLAVDGHGRGASFGRLRSSGCRGGGRGPSGSGSRRPPAGRTGAWRSWRSRSARSRAPGSASCSAAPSRGAGPGRTTPGRARPSPAGSRTGRGRPRSATASSSCSFSASRFSPRADWSASDSVALLPGGDGLRAEVGVGGDELLLLLGRRREQRLLERAAAGRGCR